MSIKELNELIDEIEWLNEDYKKTSKKRKEKILLKKKKKHQQRIKILIACGIPLSLIGLINLEIYLEKKLNNPYNGKNLKISSSSANIIKSEIEEKLNITIENNQIENYILLKAILENQKLTQEQKITASTELINIIEDNPYIEKEYAYNSLSTLTINYKERPSDTKESVLGEYTHGEIMYYSYSDIYIYSNICENVLEHELIHSLLTTNSNEDYITFIKEGLTELLNDEYFSKNPYIEFECYPYEILINKLLCEIVTEDTLLKAYTTGNIDILYNELLKIDKKTSPENFLQSINELLNNFKEGKEIVPDKVLELHNQLIKYFVYSKPKENNKDYQAFARYLELFDTLKEKEPYTSYLEIIETKGYISKIYFNKKIKNNPKNKIKKLTKNI